jgi:hypothetical protein
LEILLTKIKQEIDTLLHESPTSGSSSATKGKTTSFSNEFDCYLNDDMKMLIETYEKCSKKLNELNEKSQIKDEQNKFERKFNSDIECLELKLKYLNDKYTQMTKTQRTATQTKISDFIESLIAQYEVNSTRVYLCFSFQLKYFLLYKFHQ